MMRADSGERSSTLPSTCSGFLPSGSAAAPPVSCPAAALSRSAWARRAASTSGEGWPRKGESNRPSTSTPSSCRPVSVPVAKPVSPYRSKSGWMSKEGEVHEPGELSRRRTTWRPLFFSASTVTGEAQVRES